MASARRFALALALGVFLFPRVAIAGCTASIVPIKGFGDTSLLVDISASSPTDTWAVGRGAPKYAPSDAFTEHFDGTSWHVVPVRLFARANSLASVSAATSTEAWAVGSSTLPDGHIRYLVVHWNGASWTSMPVPGDGNYYDILTAVAVDPASPHGFWSVGFSANAQLGADTEFFHWNGTTWNNYAFKAHQQRFYGIATSPTGQTWAVGVAPTMTGTSPVSYHWDGHAWSEQILPAAGALYSVVALADDNVWAAGMQPGGALVEHFDGQTWTVVPAPLGSGGELISVSATAPNNVWASGLQFLHGNEATLVERWDGMAWSLVQSLNPSQDNGLFGIQALPSGALAVGEGRWPRTPNQPISESVSCSARSAGLQS